MAQVIRRFTATIPAGTPKAAPVTINMGFPPMEVSEIEIVIPPGPNGAMGFKIGISGLQIFPFSGDDFLVTNNEVIRWPLTAAPNSGAWSVIGYNTGTFPHSIEVRFLCELVNVGAGPGFQPLPVDSLTG